MDNKNNSDDLASTNYWEGLNAGLTVSRKTARNLAVRHKNERILTVRRKKNVNRKKI